MGKQRSRDKKREKGLSASQSKDHVIQSGYFWALLALSILPFLGSLGAEFTIDDHPLVEQNPYLRAFSWELFLDARWLRTLSLMIDSSIFGFEPLGFHIQNLLLHGLCTGLVFAVLLRLKLPVHGAFLGGVVFALHPSHVEVITNIANRKESLCFLFSLASLLAYLRVLDLAAWRQRIIYLGWTALFGVLALAAKQVAIALPLAALAYEALFIERERRFLLRYPAIPIVTALAAVAGLAAYVHFEMGWDRLLEYRTVQGFEGDPEVWEIFLISPVGFWHYLELLLVPARLCPDHVLMAAELSRSPLTYLAWGGLAAWLVIAWMLRKRAPIAAFGMWWFLVHWLPVSNLFPSASALADRYLYILSFALSLWLAYGWSRVADWLPARIDARWPIAAAGALCAALLVRSVHYNQHWMKEEGLWRKTVICEPRSFRAHVNVGSYEYLDGNYRRSREHFERAVEIRPDNPRALYNLGNAYRKLKHYREAAKAYRKASDLGLKSADERLREMSGGPGNIRNRDSFSRHLSGDRDT